jgi:hypothetical protein
LPVRGDHVGCGDGVDGQAVPADHPADAAGKREPPTPRRGIEATRQIVTDERLAEVRVVIGADVYPVPLAAPGSANPPSAVIFG